MHTSLGRDPVVTARRPGRTAGVLLLVVVVLVALPVATALALGEAPYEAIVRTFPGHTLSATTAFLRAVVGASSLVSVGALVVLVCFRAQEERLAASFEVTVLRVASTVWVLGALALVMFEALDSAGLPFEALTDPAMMGYLWQAAYAPGMHIVSAVGALIVCFGAFWANRWLGLVVPLWAAGIAVLAPVVIGQVLVGPDHDYANDAAVIQTLVGHAFFGVLAVAALRIASGRLVDPAAMPGMLRFGAVALPVMVVLDVVIAWFKLAGTGLTASLTGWQILGRWVCLAALAVLLVLMWRRGRRGALRERHVSRAFGAAALAVAGWVGIGAAMTSEPSPQYFVPTSIPQVILGYDVEAAPTAVVLATHWRANLLFLALALAASIGYLAAVRVLRQRGDRWPVGRTVAWLSGWVVVVLATSSGLGKYSGPHFGIHMIVHMGLNMLAPLLLVLGGIVTLLLRAYPRGALHAGLTRILGWRLLRLVYNPLFVFVLFVASYYGLYLTELFGSMMRFHWAHQLMNAHFLGVGYLFYALIVGVDRPPRPLPHIGKLGYVLAAMPFHAFFGVILMTSNTIVAEMFYRTLDPPWADLAAAQYLGGGVAWAGGEIPLLVVIVVLGIQWARQDAKEARRVDRHLDSGLDEDFDVYNTMLQRLSDRQASLELKERE